MPSLKLSNPFRRNTARPTLRERAAALKATAGRVLRTKAPPMSAAEPKTDEADRTALLARLLALYAEERASRPVYSREPDSVAGRAADLVQRRVWAMAREVLALPPPRTRDGLALTALASAILVEDDCRNLQDSADCAVAGLTQAVLAFTGTAEPPGFCGFGFETDCLARDRAVHSGTGSVPAWAIAEIEAEDREAGETALAAAEG